MDEAVLARLGEPYFSNKTKGTGLGLMVTLRIIEVMDGTIKFSSQKGVGTEVVIQFPKACIHADEENEQSTQSPLNSLK
ncbi:Sporulation kinase A [compost metagenome]